VVADIAKLSVGREAYYTRELATDHEQYLSGHGEAPGRWYGAGATSLGLQGEASPAGFQAMFEGRHPTTGELLGRPHGRNAVPAFDVVLRPTKSVSVLHGLGNPATGRAVLAVYTGGGNPQNGLYLAEQATARAADGSSQVVAGWSAAFAAEAHALVGEERKARLLLERADAHLSRVTADDPMVGVFGREQLGGFVGACPSLLARPHGCRGSASGLGAAAGCGQGEAPVGDPGRPLDGLRPPGRPRAGVCRAAPGD
jgi:hypothetical protein